LKEAATWNDKRFCWRLRMSEGPSGPGEGAEHGQRPERLEPRATSVWGPDKATPYDAASLIKPPVVQYFDQWSNVWQVVK
jgi:hypothetical protein